MRKSLQQRVTEYVESNGPIKTARVSTAYAAPVGNRYYGTARCEVRLNKKGQLVLATTKGAGKSGYVYRSSEDAQADCQKTCQKENRAFLQARKIGPKEIKALAAQLKDLRVD